MSQARQATLKVVIESKDVSKVINEFLKSFDYDEAVSNEADKASISLNDVKELWIGDWFPKKGAKANVSIVVNNWYGGEGKSEFSLGTFEIDELKNSFPPAEAQIKLNSIPNNSEIRNVDRSRSWEKVLLSKIAKDVADGAKMELFYDTKEDPIIERAEQSEKSDLQFLRKLCTDKGLALKVTDNKIVIFDFEKYESQPPIEIYIKGESRIIKFDATSKLNQVYQACQVTYKHGKKKEKIEAVYKDESKSEGLTLKINQKVESKEEAERLAKKKLREKNKEENKLSLIVVGNIGLSAGLTIEIKGFHVHDGKYLINKLKHNIGNSGFTTSLELTKCLQGY